VNRSLPAFSMLLALAAPGFAQAPTLAIGNPAPALQVEAWLKGSPVPAFEKGKVYVVEFWATWCGPCRASIPHLTELQAKYPDLRVVGVNVFEKYNEETRAKVQAFVDAQGPKMSYTVAYDGKAGAMANAYMKAAQQPGIPTAFIVDRQGLVTFIGYPLTMDEPLAQVMKGTYTVAMGKALQDKEEAERLQEQKRMAPMNDFMGLMRKKDYTHAYEAARAILTGDLKDDPGVLNAIAWSLVDPKAPLPAPDLDLALKAGVHACEVTSYKEAGILDTLARVYFVRGDKAKAVDFESKAIALAPAAEAADMQVALKEYQAAK